MVKNSTQHHALKYIILNNSIYVHVKLIFFASNIHDLNINPFYPFCDFVKGLVLSMKEMCVLGTIQRVRCTQFF